MAISGSFPHSADSARRCIVDLHQVQQGLQGMVRGRLMLQNLVDMIGTRRDSPPMRDEMLAVIDMVSGLTGINGFVGRLRFY